MKLHNVRMMIAAAALAVSAVGVALPAAAQGPGMMRGYNQVSDDDSTSPPYGPGMMGGYGGYGMGPGMMGGYGGYGMGPGMMGGYGGYGMGPGMMGGYGGYGMGPGMMGGYGGYGMGPGMMSGYGMGPGMMGGYGGYGMGPAMMGGYGAAWAGVLNLTDDQRSKIQDIEETLGKQQWNLMQTMHSEMLALPRAYDSKNLDVDAIMKAQKQLADTRLQMLRNALEARKDIQGVLTAEQKKRLSEMNNWRWGQ